MLKKRGHEHEPLMEWNRLQETNSFRNTTFFNSYTEAGFPSLLVDHKKLLAMAIRLVMEYEYKNRRDLPFDSVHINDIESRFTEKYLNFTKTDYVFRFDNNILIDRVDAPKSYATALIWKPGVKQVEVSNCSVITERRLTESRDQYVQDAVDYIRYYCERRDNNNRNRSEFIGINP